MLLHKEVSEYQVLIRPARFHSYSLFDFQPMYFHVHHGRKMNSSNFFINRYNKMCIFHKAKSNIGLSWWIRNCKCHRTNLVRWRLHNKINSFSSSRTHQEAVLMGTISEWMASNKSPHYYVPFATLHSTNLLICRTPYCMHSIDLVCIHRDMAEFEGYMAVYHKTCFHIILDVLRSKHNEQWTLTIKLEWKDQHVV